ncbi:MAG: class I SAM-dependent methyltransferase [bacterium]
MKIQIPSKENIKATNEEDPLKYYYLPVIKWFYLNRLEMVLNLIGKERKQRVLEIGYGSGILFPELKKRFEEIYGIDIHNKTDLVYNMLKKEGIESSLKVGNILDLPYPDNNFDCIVCISVLEHILDLDKATQEIKRVLTPGGKAIIGFPNVNKAMNFLFKIIGFEGIEKHHVSSPFEIISSMEKKFIFEGKKSFWSLYFAYKYKKDEV